MTRCESYSPCFGTIYFPTAPFFTQETAIDGLSYKEKRAAPYGAIPPLFTYIIFNNTL